MQTLTRNSTPLIFLVVISAFYVFFYQSSNVLNDYGLEKPEWLLLIDGLVVLPLLCFWCVNDKKEAAIKAIAYSCLIILLGSFVIPESSKVIWPFLESLRYLAIAAFIVLEITTIFTVIFAIKASLTKDHDPDKAIALPIEKIVGNGGISSLLAFEARVWTYALFSKKIKQQYFIGDHHFSSHKKDGTQSNQLGFILIILFELPVMHMLLHFVWSPMAANITTGLTLIGLLFFIAEYKALAIRPISVTAKSLIIRYGVWPPLDVPLSEIEHIQLNANAVRRARHVKRYNLAGIPNVEIKLTSGNYIYLGVDSPKAFVTTIESHRVKS